MENKVVPQTEEDNPINPSKLSTAGITWDSNNASYTQDNSNNKSSKISCLNKYPLSIAYAVILASFLFLFFKSKKLAEELKEIKGELNRFYAEINKRQVLSEKFEVDLTAKVAQLQSFSWKINENISEIVSYQTKMRQNFSDKLLYLDKELMAVEGNLKKSVSKTGNKSVSVSVCAIVKNENLYLQEWVDYYHKLGVSKIFLYDNNDAKGEKVQDVIQTHINSGYVKVIKYSNVKGCAQCKAYNHCYKTNKDKYGWLFFVDLDEFLHIENGLSLIEFLNDKRFEGCDAIGINWKIYGDNDLVYYDNRTLMERFDGSESYFHMNVKSIVRGGSNRTEFVYVHFPSKINKMCGANGEEMKIGRENYDRSNYNYAYIKHFATKTISEYIGKLNRAGAYSSKEKDRIFYRAVRLRGFFYINKLTPEKLMIIKSTVINKIGENHYKFYYRQIFDLNKAIYFIRGKGDVCYFNGALDKDDNKYF